MNPNDKLLALAALVLPKEAPPMEAIPRDDLVLMALISCYKRGCSPEMAICVLKCLDISLDEIREAFGRMVAYYAEKN